jgi:hypothetical protein
LKELPSKEIKVGTVILKITNGIRGQIELLIDGNHTPIENIKNKNNYSYLEINGLTVGKHHFLIMSNREVLGPSQFELEINEKHGEYKNIFSKKTRFTMPTIVSKTTVTADNNNNIRARLK